jgi:hypothetical protein
VVAAIELLRQWPPTWIPEESIQFWEKRSAMDAGSTRHPPERVLRGRDLRRPFLGVAAPIAPGGLGVRV